MALHDLTAVEQADAVRRGEVSSRELAEHYLERAHRLNDAVGAYVWLADELALQQADAADGRRARGLAPLSPLDGVVVPVKDLDAVAGVPIRYGSAAIDAIPEADDRLPARLRAAGTVMLGKTSTPEFGLPCYTEPEVAPWSRTPWDLDRSAGGSSGGAAAAVAAGLAPVAPGSDGGGSIRIPASVCGLVGLKTSRELWPETTSAADPGRLAVDGPLARTVTDAATLLDVMTGGSLRLGLDVDPGPLLVGRYCAPVIAETDVHAAALEAYEEASLLLEALGHEVIDIAVPFDLEAVPHFAAVWAAGAAAIPLDEAQELLLRPLTRWLRERGRELSSDELAGALQEMAAFGRQALTATAHLDIVLTPTLADLPSPIGDLRDDADPAADFAAQSQFTPFTSPYNITGQPAVSLPVHWTAEGLPVGVQLVGRPMGEATLLRLAAQMERARPWAHRYPEVW